MDDVNDSAKAMTLAVVICTHDPQLDQLERTLDSLRGQDLPMEQWELLVVDNASTNGSLQRIDIGWHPRARIVQESRLGLTMARIRGIQETGSDLLLFVDDDNVLAPDYLSRTLGIAKREPQLGVFGAGVLEPEYEVAPAPDLLPYTTMLALRTVPSASWSNDPQDAVIPWGAGMAVKRDVAREYARIIMDDPQKQRLDRAGNTLNSCGDDEFSWVACEMGYGKGIFPELRVRHLISRSRVDRGYLLRLAEGHAFSRTFLRHLHGLKVQQVMPSPSVGGSIGKLARLRLGDALYELHRWSTHRSRTATDRAFDEAKRKGVARFFRTIHG
ncbi:MAG TPA: glycosyltransferase [Flavobacteriales bacterium]|nr:glycosyltransferase [Flavobacteriales bacterium]